MSSTPASPASLAFPIRTAADAPVDSQAALASVQAKFGFVPNLIGALSNVPSVLQGYLSADAAFSKTAFSPSERQLILITTSVANHCGYCVAAHSTIAKGMLKVDAATVDAIRTGATLPNAKQNALVALTRELVVGRGQVAPETVDAFLAAGYRREQVAEILLGIVQKVISNYFVDLSPVALDAAFEAEAVA